MKSKFTKLFEPIRINKMVLKNRTIALAGVSADTVHMFGHVTAAEKIAKGGAAMVVTCMADVDHPKSNFYPGSLYTFRKANRDNIRSFSKKLHQYGCKYMLEIDHVGEYYRAVEGDFSLGTCNKINEKGIHVKQMDEMDMEEVSKAFCKTAKEAIDLGFDAILFDCGSGWLMSQFICPFYNKRTDEYGGPIENRAKFPLRVLKDLRKAVGKDFPIMIASICNEYFDEDGTPFEDVIKYLQMMEPYADGVIVGCGNDQTRMQMTKGCSTNLEEFMMNREYTKTLKEKLSIPVVLTNGVMSPEQAEMALQKDWADMIGLCRPLLADHQWVNKARDNREEDIVPCLRCNNCFHVSTECFHVGCSVNPYYTQTENYYLTPVHHEEISKRIVVAGAGPAGIRAALAADLCGHEVVLIEKENEVGGLLRFISKERFKKEIADYLQYLKVQLRKSNVKVLLNTVATKELIASYNPDKVIVAIGGTEKNLQLSQKAYTATEAIINEKQLKDHIIVIGGGTVGVELAIEYGMLLNKKVALIESTTELAQSANLIYRPALLHRVENCKNIAVYKNAVVDDYKDGFVLFTDENGQRQMLSGSVIVSVGMRPKYEESYQLFGVTENTIVVGDANKIGNIIDATFDGHSAGVNF